MNAVVGSDSKVTTGSMGPWTATAVGSGMASVFAASAATAALIASVHASYAGEAAAIAALIALGLTVLLGLVSVATMIVALARREGYLALSALVFVALTLGVLIMAPAIVLALT